jgi:hypothetical protein
MLGIAPANDAEHAVTLDHLAVLADRLHAGTDFHRKLLSRTLLRDKSPKLAMQEPAYKGPCRLFSQNLLTPHID